MNMFDKNISFLQNQVSPHNIEEAKEHKIEI